MLEEKAQSSVEYLLLIGGAVLVAAAVLAIILLQSGSAKNVVKEGETVHGDVLSNIEKAVNKVK